VFALRGMNIFINQWMATPLAIFERKTATERKTNQHHNACGMSSNKPSNTALLEILEPQQWTVTQFRRTETFGLHGSSCGFVFKHVRCNPAVAPRVTSGGHEDKVDVITPTKILLIGGGEF